MQPISAVAAFLALWSVPLPAKGPAPQELSDELSAPVQITAQGSPIDVDTGHAAPFVADVDGDGLKDLLVGQFAQGKLRIYRNVGTNSAPKFGAFTWFQAGGETARVPAS